VPQTHSITLAAALLSLCAPAAGALLSSSTQFFPAMTDLPAISVQGFDRTIRAFTADAYVSAEASLLFADTNESRGFEIVTSLSPAQIERADKGTSNIVSGKILRAPEPPTLIMICIGAGLMLALLLRRPTDLPRRRKVYENERELSRI
jgi:hypothetical protein